MASTVPRGFDDVLLDNLKAKLEAFRNAQALINPLVSFDVEIDKPDAWTCERPAVNLLVATDACDAGKSSGPIRSGTLTVHAQAFAPKKSARLRYLKAQILEGLFDRTTSPYFGFAEKTISIKNPSWSPLSFDDPALAVSIFAGEWTFEVGYTWTASEASGVSLDQIHAATALWAADYIF